MTDLLELAVNQVNQSIGSFCHYLTANDVSAKSHQAGFFAPKEAFALLFPGDDPRVRENLKSLLRFTGMMAPKPTVVLPTITK